MKHLGLGDAPSKYFFNIHRQNTARSQILQLKLPNGEETRDQAQILCTVGRYYSDLYSSQGCSGTELQVREKLLDRLEDKLSDADRHMLAAPPSEREVEEVLFALPENKAPGVDGVSAEALIKHGPQ